jgi:hypothetical protein
MLAPGNGWSKLSVTVPLIVFGWAKTRLIEKIRTTGKKPLKEVGIMRWCKGHGVSGAGRPYRLGYLLKLVS